MGRNADFSVVASLRGDDVNLRLAAAIANTGPSFFPLPQTIMVRGVPVSFGGLVRFTAPILEFHPNPQDLITAHFAFFSTFNANIGGGANRWQVRLDVTVSMSVILAPQNNRIVLSAILSTVTFQPLKVTFLQGPKPPPEIIDALQSPELAAIATSFVHTFGIIPIADLAPAQLVYTQPATFKESNYSVFNWFTVVLNVKRTELRVFEDAVTIAVDFAGITNGDRNALVDLTRTHGGGRIYIKERVFDDRYPNGIAPTIPDPTWYGADADFALTVNMELLSSIIEHQVSTQVSGTPISDRAVLNSIRVHYGQFDPYKDIAGPTVRSDDSLWFEIHVTAFGVRGNVNIYVQPFWEAGVWSLRVGRVDVDFPWWADLIIVIAKAVALFIGLVIGVPLSALAQAGFPKLLEAYDSIGKTFDSANPSNLENEAMKTLQEGAGTTKLPQFRYISITPAGIDAGAGRGIKTLGPLPVAPGGGASISIVMPTGRDGTPITRINSINGLSAAGTWLGLTPNGGWSVYDRRLIRTTVKLDPSWEKLNRPSLMAVWEIRRADTNAVVVTGVKPYNAPAGNGIDIPHHTKDLYYVTEFIIRCTLTMIVNNQAGEIWSDVTTIKIDDDIDRSLSFVEWGPKEVHFNNAGTNNEWQVRISRSRIHRTAVVARCKYLRVAAQVRAEEAKISLRDRSPPFRYKESLPFSRENLNAHRKELCEYCFFGGPIRIEPYPVDDWFVLDGLIKDKVKVFPNPLASNG